MLESDETVRLKQSRYDQLWCIYFEESIFDLENNNPILEVVLSIMAASVKFRHRDVGWCGLSVGRRLVTCE
jgi:hypothetical protein